MERGSDLLKIAMFGERHGISGETSLSIAGALWAGERGLGSEVDQERTHPFRLAADYRLLRAV